MLDGITATEFTDAVRSYTRARVVRSAENRNHMEHFSFPVDMTVHRAMTDGEKGSCDSKPSSEQVLRGVRYR
jgi:hypothetical protein